MTPADSSLRAAATFDLRRGASHHTNLPCASPKTKTVSSLKLHRSRSEKKTMALDIRIIAWANLQLGARGKPSTFVYRAG